MSPGTATFSLLPNTRPREGAHEGGDREARGRQRGAGGTVTAAVPEDTPWRRALGEAPTRCVFVPVGRRAQASETVEAGPGAAGG